MAAVQCCFFLLTATTHNRYRRALIVLSLLRSALSEEEYLSRIESNRIQKHASMSGEQRKAVIKNADMDEKMQQDAVDIASKALSEYNIEKVRSVRAGKGPCPGS
jgi:hypothetical protein